MAECSRNSSLCGDDEWMKGRAEGPDYTCLAGWEDLGCTLRTRHRGFVGEDQVLNQLRIPRRTPSWPPQPHLFCWGFPYCLGTTPPLPLLRLSTLEPGLTPLFPSTNPANPPSEYIRFYPCPGLGPGWRAVVLPPSPPQDVLVVAAGD